MRRNVGERCCIGGGRFVLLPAFFVNLTQVVRYFSMLSQAPRCTNVFLCIRDVILLEVHPAKRVPTRSDGAEHCLLYTSVLWRIDGWRVAQHGRHGAYRGLCILPRP